MPSLLNEASLFVTDEEEFGCVFGCDVRLMDSAHGEDEFLKGVIDKVACLAGCAFLHLGDCREHGWTQCSVLDTQAQEGDEIGARQWGKAEFIGQRELGEASTK